MQVPRGAWTSVACPPTFSVVVAAYQAASTVRAAVSSALQQTLPPLEVVVCDDGSTDGTAEVLADLSPAVQVVHQANGGESAAKNAAVRAASGDFVVVLDADDLYLPRRLEALSWLAQERPDLDVLVTDAVLEVGGRPVRRAYHAAWSFETEDQRSGVLDRNFVLGQAAVRRSTWLGAGGFDESLRLTADWDFFGRLLLSGSRAGLVDEVLAVYSIAPGSLSSNRRGLVASRVQTLERFGRRTDLSPHERTVLATALRREQHDLRRRDLGAARQQGRRAALRLAAHGDVRVRAAAVAAAVRTAPDSTSELGAGLSTTAATALDLDLARSDLTGLSPAVAEHRGTEEAGRLRADPGSLRSLHLSTWAEGPARQRVVRRLLMGLPPTTEPRAGRFGGLLTEAAFWRGARRASDREQWRRLTRTYVAFCYHRVAGARETGQERLDVSPDVFARQLRVLRLLGWRPLDPQTLASVHLGTATLPRRHYVLTLDDAYTDAVDAAVLHARHLPQVYVPTALVGTEPPWARGARVATWTALQEAAPALVLGSHAATHAPLTSLDIDALRSELRGADEALQQQLPSSTALLAYPHGRHDARVRRQAALAGYRLAWTTEEGRNGAGTEPLALRRVGVKDWDGPTALLWKALTGQRLPALWERVNRRRWEL